MPAAVPVPSAGLLFYLLDIDVDGNNYLNEIAYTNLSQLDIVDLLEESGRCSPNVTINYDNICENVTNTTAAAARAPSAYEVNSLAIVLISLLATSLCANAVLALRLRKYRGYLQQFLFVQ